MCYSNLTRIFHGVRAGSTLNLSIPVSFMHYDLGFFDKDEGRIEPGPNPFAPEKVLAMSPV